MASALEWVPDSLYNTSISTVVAHYRRYRKELRTLTDSIQFDIYYKLYNKGRLCELSMEFNELEIFARVLNVTKNRHLLHHCFQALMDHGTHISETLAVHYAQKCTLLAPSDTHGRDKAIQLGLSLGCFLFDCGWFSECQVVTSACLDLCGRVENLTHWLKAYDCCIRMMQTCTANCRFRIAESLIPRTEALIDKLSQSGHVVHQSPLYIQKCMLHFSRSLYDDSYRFCCAALQEIKDQPSNLSTKILVDVLRQCAKSCVLKRHFKKGVLLVKHAVQLARETFGAKHPKYSDALVDYGFYLLNMDSISEAVRVYQTALDIRQTVFGGNNLYVAIAHEDLAYASYVCEYSSGKFSDAREHAEKAIQIITHILPLDHLLLASSKRVKALILEEIAIDTSSKEVELKMLQEAQELHLSSLSLAKYAFGENNVQTAKHYGNLGRLYQSMKKYAEAEGMHLKAIEIKERLLGAEDYEVALSVGHLASLYNYDMHKYSEAEQLYMRSIAIGKKLFGFGYSGLEYDYRGLLRLYHIQGHTEKVIQYRQILSEWSDLRDENKQTIVNPLEFGPLQDTRDVVRAFFDFGTETA